jgi:hypothetical protein
LLLTNTNSLASEDTTHFEQPRAVLTSTYQVHLVRENVRSPILQDSNNKAAHRQMQITMTGVSRSLCHDEIMGF